MLASLLFCQTLGIGARFVLLSPKGFCKFPWVLNVRRLSN
jgi:hypothetical protein